MNPLRKLLSQQHKPHMRNPLQRFLFERSKPDEVTWQNIKEWHERKEPVAHAYAGILRKLFLDRENADHKVFLVTSAAEGDGKTMTCLNLGAAYAVRGKKVLLIDAHFRNPRLGQHLGLQGTPGLADLANGHPRLEAAAPDPALPTLHVVPRGTTREDLVDMTSWGTFSEFLKEARRRYDLVLVDGPSVASSVEPMTLGRLVDGVIFVIAVDRTQKSQAVLARNMIQKNGGRIAGVVMNQTPVYLPHFYRT